MPRAAVISIHARLRGTVASAWEDPSLVQIWGPRYSAYVVAVEDLAVFTLGRLPDDARDRQRAYDVAAQLERVLGGGRMPYGEAGQALGFHANRLRYAAPTGRVRIRWDGARQPTVWTAQAPDVDPRDARAELARRYLRVFGPTTAEAFAQWAGIGRAGGSAAFDAIRDELLRVRSPIGDAWILASDETSFRAATPETAAVRLLPSGDAFYLLNGRDREMLVPEAARQSELWTSRVWPGALVVAGEVAGTWRRTKGTITVAPWRALSAAERDAAEMEGLTLPLPDTDRPIRVRWLDGTAQG
jgi:hypothetical protein